MVAQAQANPAQLNAMNRAMLLQSGIAMIKKLPQVTGALGSSLQVPLLRMGIMTGVLLDVQIPVNVTAAATLSEFGPWNLLQQVKYTDFAGVDRINTNAWSLFALNSFKHREVAGSAVPYSGLPGFGAKDTAILSAPTAVGAGVLRFQLMVPMAYEPSSDLRGAILAQTVVGEHYITLGTSAALGGADSWTTPYVGGTVAATGNVVVQAYQFYIQQQSSNPALLPAIDLSTIYAIEGNYVDAANIVAGQSKYLNFPNNRSIMSALHVFDNGGIGTPNGTDISQITLLANANTNLRELSPSVLRGFQRSILGTDLANGAYYIGARRQPITTQLFGNVQTKLDINTVAADGPVQFVSQYESFYPSGAPLPGIQTS
jgi:hypothetical protein